MQLLRRWGSFATDFFVATFNQLEPQHHPFTKENHLPNPPLLCSTCWEFSQPMVNCWFGARWFWDSKGTLTQLSLSFPGISGNHRPLSNKLTISWFEAGFTELC